MKKILPILILIAGCNSKAFRAIQSIDKGYHLDSVAAEKRAKEISPCIKVSQDTTLPKIITNTVYDTTTLVKDTTITLPCPDGSKVSTKFKNTNYTIRSLTTVTKTYFITKTIEDKGKDITIRDREAEIKKQVGKKEFWMWCTLIITGILLIVVIVFLLGKSLKNKL